MFASKHLLSVTNILVHVIILFSFLSVFFFFHIAKIESKAFKGEIGDMVEKIVNKTMDENPKVIPHLQKGSVYIKRFKERYSENAQATVEHNTLLKFSAVFITVFLMSMLTVLLLTLSIECKKDTDIKAILAQNVVIFLFIGIVEYMFFTHVAIKYIPVVPSLMVNTMFDTAKAKMKAQNFKP